MMMLDKFPPLVRHLLIVFGGTFGGAILNAVIDAKGVTRVDWAAVAGTATDGAFYATAVVAVTLWLTPLTKQYGIGKTK